VNGHGRADAFGMAFIKGPQGHEIVPGRGPGTGRIGLIDLHGTVAKIPYAQVSAAVDEAAKVYWIVYSHIREARRDGHGQRTCEGPWVVFIAAN
jgi:hypothetical protein